jgi:hypothetical protein
MSIALSIGNNLTTGGVFTADAVNNTSVTNVTDFASLPAGGALKLLSTQTASASATIDFTSSIDSTYDSYVFKFINIHPATDGADFTFQVDTGTNTNYNQTMTTTSFRAYHTEADDENALNYDPGRDLAQSTSFKILTFECGNDSDENTVGILQLYNPSSSTFVKHFISTIQSVKNTPMSVNKFNAGYINTTTPITRIRFKFSSGNIDDGIIKMYGVK